MDIPTLSIDLFSAALRNEELQTRDPEALRQAVQDYARFLALVQAYPDEPLAPTRAIDDIWHLHMQHPRAYGADCHRLFGDLLDHDGGFGATPDEAPILEQTFRRTADLWLQAFGRPYVGDATKCTRNCVSRCKRACKTGPGVA